MPYSDQQKESTATILRQLRKSRKNKNGKIFSFRALEADIKSKYPDAQISDKSLMYYEIRDKGNAKFYIGKGMKIETLVLLADYYGVSCDFLLGRKSDKVEAVREISCEIGLDEYSAGILLCMARNRVNYRGVLHTLNSLIHSIRCDLADETSEESLSSSPLPCYITKGFMNILVSYLYFSCEQQNIDLESSFEVFGKISLNDDKIANLLLIELQNQLRLSRDMFCEIREKPQKDMQKVINSGKRKHNVCR